MNNEAFLFILNPAKYDFKELATAGGKLDNQISRWWSAGNCKRMEIGDTFFMIRLGKDKSIKGLIGYGKIGSKPEAAPHWDFKKALQGKTSMRANIVFDVLSDKVLIPYPELVRLYPDYHWSPMAPKAVPEDMARTLKAIIDSRI